MPITKSKVALTIIIHEEYRIMMSRGSSSSSTSYYRPSTCTPRAVSPPRNYRPCHLKLPQLLAAASNAFSQRCSEIDYPTTSWTGCCNSARTSLSAGEEPFVQSRRIGKMDQMPLTCRSQSGSPYYTKYLEGKVTTIQEKHQTVLAENANLNNQLSKATARTQELEEKAAQLEEALRREKQQSHVALHHRAVNTAGVASSLEASTSTMAQSFVDRSIQTISLEEVQQTVVDCSNADDADLISISKSELDALENDMKSLRDAVRAKEELWDQAVAREQSYREHLARLSVELITIRQLSDSRLDELQRVEKKLTANNDELRATQKDLALAKKAIVKLQKRQRQAEGSGINQEQPSDDLENKQQLNPQVQSPLAKQRSPKKMHQVQVKDARCTAPIQQRHRPRDYSPRIETMRTKETNVDKDFKDLRV
ncbi:myosin-2 heavy chain-like isoform X2 [Nasonia vitripennis]|uniref:Uncharacterized protein n=2 Tax=Nasonia vitripennis TaxID=7425 RepID=A0A7M7H7K8_NASVI|nr:myosin-2 heavy chain-like isoform X2 [Nasonia vitripennis]